MRKEKETGKYSLVVHVPYSLSPEAILVGGLGGGVASCLPGGGGGGGGLPKKMVEMEHSSQQSETK